MLPIILTIPLWLFGLPIQPIVITTFLVLLFLWAAASGIFELEDWYSFTGTGAGRILLDTGAGILLCCMFASARTDEQALFCLSISLFLYVSVWGMLLTKWLSNCNVTYLVLAITRGQLGLAYHHFLLCNPYIEPYNPVC